MNKSQYLLLTDTHLSDNNIDLVTDIFKQAIKVCKEKNIDTIFHLGDWFTSRKAQSLAVLKATDNIISMFRSAVISCHIIAGNHDKVEADTEESYLDIFDGDYFHVYKQEYILTLTPDLHITLLPYFKESGSYIKRLPKPNQKLLKGKHILLTHIGVNGVKNNDGSEVENDLLPGKFKEYDLVLSGHYHNYSKVGDNIYYIGSAYQANFGEDDEKGFVILNEDGELEYIRSKFPKYIKLKVNIDDQKAIKQIKKEHANSKDNIRIVFTGDETQLASINKEQFNAIGIDVKFDKEVIRQDLSAVLNTNINFNRSNIKDAFEQFCELNDYKDKKIGIEYLKKIE